MEGRKFPIGETENLLKKASASSRGKTAEGRINEDWRKSFVEVMPEAGLSRTLRLNPTRLRVMLRCAA